MSSINPEFYAPYDYTPDVPRARHNLSTKRSHTLQTGFLKPVLFHRLYKGDDFKINPMTLLQSILPLNKPLLDCFELRVETYLCPLTNYYGWMDNNSKNDIEEYVSKSPKWQVDLYNDASDNGLMPLFQPDDLVDVPQEDLLQAFVNNPSVINRGSMFECIGVPAGFCGSSTQNGEMVDVSGTMFNTVNIERMLCYLDIVRSYHVNTQYESIYFSNGDNWNSGGDPDDIFSQPFTHQTLDDLFTELRYLSKDVSQPLEVIALSESPSVSANARSTMSALVDYLRMCTKRLGGFFPVQHRPDLWRNLLSSNYGSVNAKVQQNADGSINIHEIQDKNHLQSLYDSLYLSGGRYANILRTVFGMRSHHELKIPELLSVSRQLIDPSNITAQAATADADLGQKASNVDKFNTSKPIRVRPDVDSYLVVVASVTPLIDYGQGFDPEITHLSFNDDFTPQLQGMSFESVPLGFYTALPSIQVNNEVGFNFNFPDLSIEQGKNVKWMHYRTDVSRVYGEFTPLFGEYQDMVLSRRYTQWGYLLEDDVAAGTSLFTDIGPYVNPLEYNGVFSNNSIYEEPWSLHVSFNVRAKRPILKRIKPRM